MGFDFKCRLASKTAAAALLGQLVAWSGNAQAGFFDELFGQLFRPPAYESYEPAFRRRRGHWGHRWTHESAPRKRVVVAERTAPPVLPQQPVNIMEDSSLRKGDAVVMESGIRIFVGARGDRHEPEDFKKPSEIRGLSRAERKALAAFDAPAAATSDAEILAGRSATGSSPSAAEPITDAKGRAIRYVGP
jgi:hypothetical protein